MIHKVKLTNSKEVLLIDEKTYQFFSTDPYYVKINFLNRLRIHASGCAVFQRHIKGSMLTLYAHRVIAEKFKFRQRSKYKTVVSAVNGNKLDCRLENLVWRSRGIAMRHRKTRNRNGYTGVYKENGRYRAVIGISGKTVHIGMYPTREEAAMAYNKMSRIFYGADGKINIIKAVSP